MKNTLARLPLSKAAFDEITAKLVGVGYSYRLNLTRDQIDMSGLALEIEDVAEEEIVIDSLLSFEEIEELNDPEVYSLLISNKKKVAADAYVEMLDLDPEIRALNSKGIELKQELAESQSAITEAVMLQTFIESDLKTVNETLDARKQVLDIESGKQTGLVHKYHGRFIDLAKSLYGKEYKEHLPRMMRLNNIQSHNLLDNAYHQLIRLR